MVFDRLHLKDTKIRYANMRIASAEKAIAFWQTTEDNLRDKYRNQNNPIYFKHIHNIKQYRKEAVDDLKYWQGKLVEAQNLPDDYQKVG